MERYIVVEGKIDAELIDTLIDDDQVDVVGIAVAGGGNAALLLANSLSVAQRVPVALIVDADTLDSDRIREQELDFQDFVEDLGVDIPPVLFMGVPTVEEAMKDPEWTAKIREFIRNEDYSLENPFQYRR